MANTEGFKNWGCAVDHCSDVTDCKSVKGDYLDLQC